MTACPEGDPGSVGEGGVGDLEQADVHLSLVLGEDPPEGAGLSFELDTLLGGTENESAYRFKELFGCVGDVRDVGFGLPAGVLDVAVGPSCAEQGPGEGHRGHCGSSWRGSRSFGAPGSFGLIAVDFVCSAADLSGVALDD
jgi:hypothetical protein